MATVRAAGQTRERPRTGGEQRLQENSGAISMTMQLYYRALAVQIAQGRSHAGACVRIRRGGG